ncbi:MAG: ribosome maturation factor RimP, partial [Deltaproteobacteria bacterium]
EKDFVWAMGKKVKVRMKDPLEGRRNFAGRLEDMKEGMIVVALDKGRTELLIQDIEKATVVYE